MNHLSRDTQRYLLEVQELLDDMSGVDDFFSRHADYHAGERLVPALNRGVNLTIALKQELWRYQWLT